MTNHKRLLAGFFDATAAAAPTALEAVLASHCQPDCVWDIAHPFGRCIGHAQVAEEFWRPLSRAMADWDFRPAMMLSGRYEDAPHVNALGIIMGTLAGEFLSLPATHQLSFLRFGISVRIEDGQFAHVHIMLDLIDLMRQVGHYPLRTMPGTGEQWPFAPGHAGFSLDIVDGERAARSLAIVLQMQYGLPAGHEIVDSASAAAAHSPHWHRNMNWYGPAGIGSARGMRGFRDYHGALFLKAFPDRSGIARTPGTGPDRAGDYVRLGDGRFAVTGGWPAMRGSHTGGQWLGLPPTGRELSMRVADWYRLDEDDKIVDNWVMIDIPHMLDQMGIDIFDDLRFFVDRSRPRL